MYQFTDVDEAIAFLHENIHLERGATNFPELGRYLGQSQDERAFAPLLAALQHGGEYIRSDAAIGLAYLGRTEAIPHLILAFVNDPGLYVRCDCALALGYLGAEDALSVFLARFPDEHFEVQKRIITATTEIGTASAKQALKVLEHALSDSEEPQTQKEFLRFLLREGSHKLGV